MKVSIKIEGLADLEKKLIAIEDKTLSKKVMRKALMSALSPIWKEARLLVPVKTGGLRKAIRRKVSISGKKMEGGIRMNSRNGGDGWKWAFFETGSSAHEIVPKRKGGKKALASRSTGKFFGPKVSHPGNKHKPFLRPAWDKKIGEAVRNFRDMLKKQIDEVAKNGK